MTVENPARDSLSVLGVLFDTLVAGNYVAAESICDNICAAHRDAPICLYARSTVIYSRIFDNEDTTGQAEFFGLTDRAIAELDSLLESDAGGSASEHYLRGACLSAQALILNRSGSRLSAVRRMMSSRDSYARAIALDPEFYDAYLGRGAYRYAVATNARLVGFLPFIPSKESGWSDMWLVVERSRFSKWSALTALVWFIIEDGDLTLADSICGAGLERFPDSRSFLWPKLAVQSRSQDWQGVKSTALRLFTQYDSLGTNPYDRIGLCTQLARACDSLNAPDEALEWAKRGLLIPRNADISHRRRQKIRELEIRVR